MKRMSWMTGGLVSAYGASLPFRDSGFTGTRRSQRPPGKCHSLRWRCHSRLVVQPIISPGATT